MDLEAFIDETVKMEVSSLESFSIFFKNSSELKNTLSNTDWTDSYTEKVITAFLNDEQYKGSPEEAGDLKAMLKILLENKEYISALAQVDLKAK